MWSSVVARVGIFWILVTAEPNVCDANNRETGNRENRGVFFYVDGIIRDSVYT